MELVLVLFEINSTKWNQSAPARGFEGSQCNFWGQFRETFRFIVPKEGGPSPGLRAKKFMMALLTNWHDLPETAQGPTDSEERRKLPLKEAT